MTDGDNSVSFEEMKEIFSKLGFGGSEETELKSYFDQLDRDKSGFFSS